MRALVLFLTALVLGGCSNISQMQKKYEAGDHSQLAKLMQIAARTDYPYATRKRAVVALGEIANPEAVPVLIGALRDYDQRTTLKQEALKALGKIGDPVALDPIGHMLDYAMEETNAELRLAAIPVLGQIGTPRAAEILINALRHYDLIDQLKQQRVRRGIFSGDAQTFPYGYGPGQQADSLGGPVGMPSIGGFPTQEGVVDMFGMDPRKYRQEMYDSTEEEMAITRSTLVSLGAVAVPVIKEAMVIRTRGGQGGTGRGQRGRPGAGTGAGMGMGTSPSFRELLMEILYEIEPGTAVAADSSATAVATEE